MSNLDINRGFPTGATAPSGPVPSKATPLPTPKVSGTGGAAALFTEPDAGFTWLYTLVNQASSTIDLTMYELVDTTFSADLVSACQRGVHVRVILDQSLERSNNTPAYAQLNSAGANCSAAWSNPQFQATHEKSMVLDGTTAIIMTFNLTSRYYATSRDLAVVEHDAADIAAIEGTFNTDLNSTTDRSYRPAAGDDLIWSPTTAEADLLGLINGAHKTLLVENEELAASNIVQALASACQRGVSVELAMTDTSTKYHANYTALQQAGCVVHIGANNPSTLYIHAKAIIADLGTAQGNGYVGSINFSIASMTENRELGRYVHDPALLTQVGNTIGHDFAQFPPFQ